MSIPDLGAITSCRGTAGYAVAPANPDFHSEPYSHDFRRILQNQIAGGLRRLTSDE